MENQNISNYSTNYCRTSPNSTREHNQELINKKMDFQQISDKFNKFFKWDDNEELLKKMKLLYFSKKYLSQGEKIKCPICSYIPIDSIQCNKCEKLFCKDCIKDQEKCKNCKGKFISKTTDKTLIEVIEEISIYCPYNNTNNNHKTKIKDYKNHILNCDFANYKCLTCDKVIKGDKKECIKHSLECGYSDSKCCFCGKTIKLYKKKEHETKCGNENINCELCNELIKRKNINKHKDQCKKNSIICKICNQKCSENHSSENCKDNQIEYWKELYLKEKRKVEMYEQSVIRNQETLYSISSQTERILKPSNSQTNFNTYKTYSERNTLKKNNLDLDYTKILEIKSQILTNEDKIFLNKYFINNENKKDIKLHLSYSMSKNGVAQNFHEFVDNKGPTISIFKIKNKNIRYGGFASKSWDSKSNEKYDENAFIFSLNNQKIFKTTNPEKSIFCNESYGPFFGGNLQKDNAELWSFNTKGGFYRHNVYEDFKIECTQGLKEFDFEEIEVFLVSNY